MTEFSSRSGLSAPFIPEQPHPLLIPHGPPGGAKSTFCKQQLQIAIDPYAGEPLILPTEKKGLTNKHTVELYSYTIM